MAPPTPPSLSPNLLAQRPAAEIAAVLEASLRQARARPEDPSLDRSVLGALRELPGRNALLAQVALDELAALLERATVRVRSSPDDGALRALCWEALDLVGCSAVLRRIPEQARAGWAEAILRALRASHYTLGPLFARRVEAYGGKALFRVPEPRGDRAYSWRQTAARVETLARGFMALEEGRTDRPLAILSENRIEVVWVDLACLTSGRVSVPVPATCTEADVGFILERCGARTVVCSREQWPKILPHRSRLPHLRHVVLLDEGPRAAGSLDLDAIERLSAQVGREAVWERAMAARADDLATIMFSSGTTGRPKGIQFSHQNLVFKRFARALALPEIGEEDVFLCYLPLYHTFGRFLEMLGCVFWGSTYGFLLSASVDALLEGMRRYRPTVFISVPRKWLQLYEAIARAADPERASDEALLAATRRLTGGRLRWGLSAAGHLDAEIFRFFQRQGIELMSGFGMTEATGGITMTPPGRYRDNSLGVPLPGIEVRLADDGELCVRGAYVTPGYLDPQHNAEAFDAEGWLHTGDLMERDAEGHFYLVDRKKEIYKNVKGETIAPQRIENLFRDLEAVGRVFLVGDRREYNTALIYPNPSCRQPDFRAMDREAITDYFRSLVVSVNQFLAPFERIVDFAILDRDLDPERGELTAKGTPRRKVVERHFAPLVASLYRRTNLAVGGVEIVLPNWLLQSLGLTAREFRSEGERLVARAIGRDLAVRRVDDTTCQIGSCLYVYGGGPLDLGALLRTPQLWLGNEALVDFVPLDLTSRQRPRAGEGLRWAGRAVEVHGSEALRAELEQALAQEAFTLLHLHQAAQGLHADEEATGLAAVRVLEAVLDRGEAALAEAARVVLRRAAEAACLPVRRRALLALLANERPHLFPRTLRSFLFAPGALLDEATRESLVEADLDDSRLDALLEATAAAASWDPFDEEAARRCEELLRLLADYGAAHPTRYRRIRAFLTRLSLFAGHRAAREEAARATRRLQEGFRRWLGPSEGVAVDPETGKEYRWSDVVAFDDDVPAGDRQRLLWAIRQTEFLREAVFLFSKAATVRLSDIPPRGVWVRPLGARYGKTVYRITIQTRYQGSYEVAANLNHDLSPQQVHDEIRWLVLCGEPGERAPLVEAFGGYWPEQDLWSEEFIPGETLDRALRRMARRKGEEERLRQLWPFFAWSALSAYVDFWNRTGRRWEISEPTAANVIVPTHDYLTGARLVSISARRPFRTLVAMLRALREQFVPPVEEAYPLLAGVVGWDLIANALLEVVGEEEGLGLLRDALAHPDADPALRRALESAAARVEAEGFVPLRLHFAVQRYRRWERLSGEPTLQARARTMQELYEDYGIGKLLPAHPEARVRFFRDTVLHAASPALRAGLEGLVLKLRRRELGAEELVHALADLRAQLNPAPDEDYFLARLSYPHLRPEDEAGFVRADLGGKRQSEVVVTLEDHDGNPFHIRHALNPKEVARLHRLFLESNLEVRFRPEHRYLVALNDRLQLIGGIYYDIEEDGTSAHLEKIVVAESYRKKGIAHALMQEFCNRLRAAGVKAVTTGFYRPEYFYGFGFKLERHYAGLVKPLDKPES